MKTLITLILITSFANIIKAQTPHITWQKSFGNADDDQSFEIQQTSDGGYIVIGHKDNGSIDYRIIKLTSTGSTTWQKSLGGTNMDFGRSIIQTSDGGYIAAGYSRSTDGYVTSGNHGDFDMWIIKLTNLGNIAWQKSLGGTSSDEAQSIQQTSDGGYIVAGRSSSHNGDASGTNGLGDYWIVKLTSNGAISWEKSLGGSGMDLVNTIRQTSNGGYIIAGSSESNDGDVTGNHGNFDMWIVNLNNLGDIIWEKSLGGSFDDRAYSAQQTSDGNYIVAGFGGSNATVIKLDSLGDIIWLKSMGGSGSDQALSIQQTSDEGYIVAGSSSSNNGDVSHNNGGTDYWIIKLTESGIISWEKSLGGSNTENAWDIKQTLDGGYIVCGQSNSNDGDITGNQGAYDMWVVKLSATIGLNEIEKLKLFNIFPNPTTGSLTINLKEAKQDIKATLTNSFGKIILIKQFDSLDLINMNIDAPSGIYFLQIETRNEEARTIKILKK